MEGSGSFVSLLRPIIDTYMDASVGLIGCRSMGIERQSCEYDLLLVRPEHNPPATLKFGDSFVDLAFSTENELHGPQTPENAASLALMKPVRDTGLILATSAAAARESLERSHRKGAEERLAASVKAMGRAEEAISKGHQTDADFWLATAGYDFGYAWMYKSGRNPAPSHLLGQLRQLSRGQQGMFEAFSNAVGLQAASRAACEARLESLGIIYDLKEVPGKEPHGASPESIRASYELLRSKSTATLLSQQPVDSYCFLGLEVVRSLPRLLANQLGGKETSEIITSLSGRDDRLIAVSVVKALGMGRSQAAVEKGLGALRKQVSALTRKN